MLITCVDGEYRRLGFKGQAKSVYDTTQLPSIMTSKFSASDKAFIITHYPTKGSRYCAMHLNQPFRRVQAWANKRGLRVTAQRNLERQRENILVAHTRNQEIHSDPTSYRVNPTQFINVTTPEVAYILGLLWADGYIQGKWAIKIEASQQDLETLYPVFLKTGDWRAIYRHRHGRKPQMLVHTSNRPLVEHLVTCDYVSKSTASADKILSHIPDHLRHYWWRGLVDGDGCFYVQETTRLTQMTIASSYEQDWTFAKRLFESLDIALWPVKREQIRRKDGRVNRSSTLRLTKRGDIVKLGEYLYRGYPNDGIGLARKHEKWSRIREMYLDATSSKHRDDRTKRQVAGP